MRALPAARIAKSFNGKIADSEAIIAVVLVGGFGFRKEFIGWCPCCGSKVAGSSKQKHRCMVCLKAWQASKSS